MGRKPIPIDAKAVEALASCGATTEEIAAKLDCSKDTLERRFAAHIIKGKAAGRASLRGKQFEKAMKGNGDTTMLIWLGKQLLGQRDKQTIDINSLTPEQALAILAAEGDTAANSGD